jgi:hypothetical protein
VLIPFSCDNAASIPETCISFPPPESEDDPPHIISPYKIIATAKIIPATITTFL